MASKQDTVPNPLSLQRMSVVCACKSIQIMKEKVWTNDIFFSSFFNTVEDATALDLKIMILSSSWSRSGFCLIHFDTSL